MIIPGVCLSCFGKDEHCQRCGGTGKAAFKLPDNGPMFTRVCPDCGWENGMYFPQPGMFMPVDGSNVEDSPANFCMLCKDDDGSTKRGHMIWKLIE